MITLHVGDSAEVLKQYPDNHFDSIVTDPPYGIEFLGKEWDKNTGAIEVWQECLRVLKPGGHILAFSAARTYHRLATNLEDIGFEIRDQIMWIYGSGFPKGQDMGKLIEKREGKRKNAGSKKLHVQVDPAETGNTCSTCGKRNTPLNIVAQCQTEGCNMKERIKPADNEWSGWKTGLKPAHEPIVMARKPFKGSTVDNVIKYGTGAINIDDTRVGNEKILVDHKIGNSNSLNYKDKGESKPTHSHYTEHTGRYPSNVIMSEQEGKVLDEQTGIKKYGNKKGGYKYDKTYNVEGFIKNNKPQAPSNYGDGGGASKYFYCPKVSRKERNIGCDMHEPITGKDVGPWSETGERLAVKLDKMTTKHNNHPTVKPVALMKYLVTLITPPGGKVLDPFNGSGSTGMAVKEFGGEYVGIDMNPDYIEISNKRINAW